MEQQYEPPVEEQHLFDDFNQLREASQGNRVLNYIIDNLFMRFALAYATGYLAAKLLLIIAPDFLIAAVSNESSFDYYALLFIIGYFNYLIYYTITEAGFKGMTLGKLITGTRAVREDGNPLTFKDAMLRSLSRIVPFEVFSALGGKPWHDSWTKTMVIKVR